MSKEPPCHLALSPASLSKTVDEIPLTARMRARVRPEGPAPTIPTRHELNLDEIENLHFADFKLEDKTL